MTPVGLRRALIACVCFASAPGVRAQDDPDGTPGEHAGAYCAWVRAEAEADRAIALAPELFVGAGVVAVASQGGTDADPTTVGDNLPRVASGVRWDVADLRRARALQDRADAACRAQRAEAELVAWLSAAEAIGLRRALAAQLAALNETLDRARGRLQVVERRLDAAEAAVDDVLDVRHRVALMESARGQLEDALDAARARRDPPPGTLDDAVDAVRRSASTLAATEHALRDSRAWSFEVRVGYDQVFGAERDLPFVAFLQASFDLGRLFTRSPHERARAARAGVFVDGELTERIRALEDAMERGARRTERRLREIAGHIEALSSRRRALVQAGVETTDARRLETALWFEIRGLEAEAAFQRARLEALRSRLR